MVEFSSELRFFCRFGSRRGRRLGAPQTRFHTHAAKYGGVALRSSTRGAYAARTVHVRAYFDVAAEWGCGKPLYPGTLWLNQ